MPSIKRPPSPRFHWVCGYLLHRSGEERVTATSRRRLAPMGGRVPSRANLHYRGRGGMFSRTVRAPSRPASATVSTSSGLLSRERDRLLEPPPSRPVGAVSGSSYLTLAMAILSGHSVGDGGEREGRAQYPWITQHWSAHAHSTGCFSRVGRSVFPDLLRQTPLQAHLDLAAQAPGSSTLLFPFLLPTLTSTPVT